MKIDYQNKGNAALIIITSFITERRLHNRCVDAALLAVGKLRTTSFGVLFRKTAITGKANHMMRAYKIICREASRDK
ncbi:hypothetical protein [Xenorhabdus kozodoii]|uniref:Uncharacterized protein n=1 Tax=Xenorhabdus kozodoii TaxID=351676 RepID=A0A2D0L3G3_9GAMM|nr:hypothetical protein [Xenorhabdus kozodoii]PHM70219.1 hypothetical protein Xkoz_03204 [Xenorhabdus kozodoii]